MINLKYMNYIVKAEVCGGLSQIVIEGIIHAQRSMVVSEMVHANSLKQY